MRIDGFRLLAVVFFAAIAPNSNSAVAGTDESSTLPFNTQRSAALQLSGFDILGVPECVLPINATVEQEIAFAECIANTDCKNWTRQLNDDDPTIARRLVGSNCTPPTWVCVLSGSADVGKERRFEMCKATRECANWTEHLDETNGNRAHICSPDPSDPSAR